LQPASFMKLLAIDCAANLCAACVYDAAAGKELGRSVLDDEALALNVPKFPQPLSEALDVGGIDHRRGSFDHADATELLWFLRLGARRSEDGASQATQERTSVHKSPLLAASLATPTQGTQVPYQGEVDEN